MTDGPVFENVDGGTPAGARGTRLEWLKPSGMFGLSLVIFLLRMLTLGVYHFWGKTDVRKKIWSSIRLQGQPLEYTGTGMELFLGFLITLFLVFLPLYALLIGAVLVAIQTFGPQSPWVNIAMIPFMILIFYLVGVGMYRAMRYRLSRTNWRGIRGALTGNSWSFGWTFLWTTLAAIPTLGWSIPWQSAKLQKIMTEDMRFGEEPFRFTGSAGPLYGPFTLMWLAIVGLYAGVGYYMFAVYMPAMEAAKRAGTPPPVAELMTFFAVLFIAMLIYAILSAFFYSKMYNHFISNTHIQNARFDLKTTPFGLIALIITNALIVIGTLGIATPIAQTRLAGYFVRNADIVGDVDFDKIAQSQVRLDKTGEGLAEAFDIDAF